MTDLATAVTLGRRLADRLSLSRAQLAPRLPIAAERIDTLDDATAQQLDAFLKRYENLVNHLQDQVWRLIVDTQGLQDPRQLSRRDILDYLERLHVIESADAFLEVVKLRNRLSHVYPGDPRKHAAQLNEAWRHSVTLLDALAGAEAWMARRLGASPDARKT